LFDNIFPLFWIL